MSTANVWRAMRFSRLLFCICAGIVLSGLVASADERNMTSILEAKLRWWKPQPINNQTPSNTLRAPNMNIEGKYGHHSSWGGSTLTIRRLRGQEYSVELEWGNCTSYSHFKRKGRYADGVLILDRPLYAENPYLRFYPVRARGKDYLLPDARVADFEKALRPGQTKLTNKNGDPYVGYPRLPEEKP